MNMLLQLFRRLSLPSSGQWISRVSAVAALTLLFGCAGTPERPAEEPASVPWPDFAPPHPNEETFRVDPANSQLRIRVDPEGAMARLGHSHIIGGSVISGTVILGDGHESARLDLSIDASALEVDRPEWRAAAGLEADLDQSAISGTRANMLGKRVLNTESYPEISVRSTGVSGPAWLADVTVRIRLVGEVLEVVVPVAVERTDRRLIASGKIDLLQSDFGIEPFSTAGGALRVSDRMRIRFRIAAERIRQQ